MQYLRMYTTKERRYSMLSQGNGKERYNMATTDKYNTLTDESKREIAALMAFCPDEYDNMVDYYYDAENAPPAGWFVYWE